MKFTWRDHHPIPVASLARTEGLTTEEMVDG